MRQVPLLYLDQPVTSPIILSHYRGFSGSHEYQLSETVNFFNFQLLSNWVKPALINSNFQRNVGSCNLRFQFSLEFQIKLPSFL